MRRPVLAVAAVVALGTLTGQALGAPPVPQAKAYEIVNASNGEVLASHNAQERLPIASLTKLMTVIVALKHLPGRHGDGVAAGRERRRFPHSAARRPDDHRQRPAEGRADPKRERRRGHSRRRRPRRHRPLSSRG
jgi:D-alanyl-D-alanine carboxypeptidase